jgi:hypothetical protein
MVILSFDEMVNDGFDLMKRDRRESRSRSAPFGFRLGIAGSATHNGIEVIADTERDHAEKFDF